MIKDQNDQGPKWVYAVSYYYGYITSRRLKSQKRQVESWGGDKSLSRERKPKWLSGLNTDLNKLQQHYINTLAAEKE